MKTEPQLIDVIKEIARCSTIFQPDTSLPWFDTSTETWKVWNGKEWVPEPPPQQKPSIRDQFELIEDSVTMIAAEMRRLENRIVILRDAIDRQEGK